jgi:uncharacterized membrane protein YkvA (DUF1232 family)
MSAVYNSDENEDDRKAAEVHDSRPVDPAGFDPELRVPEDAYDRFRDLVHAAARRLAGGWGDDAVEVLLLVPDLLLLFAGVARDPRVSRRHKLLAAAIVAYLVSPVDLMPEALLGPLGMADDIALAFLGLDLLLNRVPREVLLDHWRGERDILEVARVGTALGARLVPRPLYDRISRWLARQERAAGG